MRFHCFEFCFSFFFEYYCGHAESTIGSVSVNYSHYVLGAQVPPDLANGSSLGLVPIDVSP